MPYVFVEQVEEGMQEADVIERSDFDALSEELESVRNQRDSAIERAVKAEEDYGKMREKYANTFLTSKPKKEEMSKPINLAPQSLEELFS